MSIKKFSVITGKFEDTVFEDNTFDLVFSATAFHWVPEKIGYEKVFSMLKNGGAFARFANHPYRDKENVELSQEIDKIYDLYYNKYYNKERENNIWIYGTAGKRDSNDCKQIWFFRY